MKGQHMKRTITLLLALGMLATAAPVVVAELTEEMKAEGWFSIFDGTTLNGWELNEPDGPGTFAAVDGTIVGTGGRNHLFYRAEQFQNFELKADVKINNDGNSGLYVKSQWQTGWPTTGFEVQINSTHGDPQKTGSLYNIVRIYEAPHADDEWFTFHIICRGNAITVRVNDKPLYTYVEPPRGQGGRGPGGQGQQEQAPITEQNKRISQSGYIALQQHHDGSVVHFRNIFVRKL
jgi:hypothetical protein